MVGSLQNGSAALNARIAAIEDIRAQKEVLRARFVELKRQMRDAHAVGKAARGRFRGMLDYTPTRTTDVALAKRRTLAEKHVADYKSINVKMATMKAEFKVVKTEIRRLSVLESTVLMGIRC
jgi:hypothetical protein